MIFPAFRFTPRTSVAAVASLFMLAACGGSEREPKTAADDIELESDYGDSSSGMAVSSEVGGLDEDKVNATFESSVRELQRCLNRGAGRLEFLGGGVSFFIQVDSEGQIVHAYLEQSTLGDRKTEKCMLGALKAKSWPKPVGGRVGHARKSFDFDPPNDVRPPTEWSSDHIEEALEKESAAIAQCKAGNRGKHTATMYIGTKGQPLAVGVTPPDERGEAAVDCLVDVLQSITYPSPGSWPAKLSFEL
jgi:hypothetical protein